MHIKSIILTSYIQSQVQQDQQKLCREPLFSAEKTQKAGSDK